MQTKINPDLENQDNVPNRWYNAAIPILLLIFLVFLGLILTGVDAVQASPGMKMSIENVFGESDSSNSLLWATLFVSVLCWGLYRIQYHNGKQIFWRLKRPRGTEPILKLKGASTSLLVCVCLPQAVACFVQGRCCVLTLLCAARRRHERAASGVARASAHGLAVACVGNLWYAP